MERICIETLYSQYLKKYFDGNASPNMVNANNLCVQASKINYIYSITFFFLVVYVYLVLDRVKQHVYFVRCFLLFAQLFTVFNIYTVTPIYQTAHHSLVTASQMLGSLLFHFSTCFSKCFRTNYKSSWQEMNIRV